MGIVAIDSHKLIDTPWDPRSVEDAVERESFLEHLSASFECSVLHEALIWAQKYNLELLRVSTIGDGIGMKKLNNRILFHSKS